MSDSLEKKLNNYSLNLNSQQGYKLNHMKANLNQKKVKEKTNWYRRERA